MKHIEIKNLLESYTKQLSKSRASNSNKNVQLPRLMQSHSYHNLIIRKIEKLRALNCRNRHNSGKNPKIWKFNPFLLKYYIYINKSQY